MNASVKHDAASSGDENRRPRTKRETSERRRHASRRRHSSQRPASQRRTSHRAASPPPFPVDPPAVTATPQAWRHASQRPISQRRTSHRAVSPTSPPIDPPVAATAPPPPQPRNPRPSRPELQRRRTTAKTRYIDMLLGLDHVSPLHNILASVFVWILLAGYIVFPATFNSLQKTSYDDKANTRLKAEVLATARNLPLLYVAAAACGIGVLGCVWLWWKHRGNYVWVINRIFLPSLLNSVAGLVSTLVNVYSAQDGRFLLLDLERCL